MALSMREKTERELARQQAILARQERQFDEAAPRARFAYASHITKTRMKIGRLERDLRLYR